MNHLLYFPEDIFLLLCLLAAGTATIFAVESQRSRAARLKPVLVRRKSRKSSES